MEGEVTIVLKSPPLPEIAASPASSTNAAVAFDSDDGLDDEIEDGKLGRPTVGCQCTTLLQASTLTRSSQRCGPSDGGALGSSEGAAVGSDVGVALGSGEGGMLGCPV